MRYELMKLGNIIKYLFLVFVIVSCTNNTKEKKSKLFNEKFEKEILENEERNFISKDSTFHIINLSRLNIDTKGFFKIKDETYNVSEVKRIRLGDEREEEYKKERFPYEIFKFKNLEYLWIGMRGFKEIPSEIETLNNLTVLDLQHGNIRRLPKEIIKLEKLEKITLLWSNIEELPNDFHKMKNLKSLHLGCTQFDSVPEELFKMNNLESLILSHVDECQVKRRVFTMDDILKLKSKLIKTNLLIGSGRVTNEH